MSKQTVFRVAKNKDNPYVMLNKRFLEHPELSYRAKGILAYILSKPDHWRLAVSDLVNHGKEGRDAIYATLKELIRHGFIQHICYRKNGKISHYEYIVYEQPLKTPIERLTYTMITSTSSDMREEPYASPLPENPETASPEATGTLSPSLHPDIPKSVPSLDTSAITPLPENPDSENPTQVSNDFNNKLINKTRSSHARGTIYELWQEIFQAELSERECDALLNVCSRTTLVRNVCLIQEHHNISSILSPFAFVMSCVTGDGYKVTRKETTPRRRSEKQVTNPPMPKTVQRQREGKRLDPEVTPEKLAKVKARIAEKIQLLYGDGSW